jgi:hypothetical protein
MAISLPDWVRDYNESHFRTGLKMMSPKEFGEHNGLYSSSWTKCVRVVGKIEHPGTREKGSCHEETKNIQHRTQTSGCGRTVERGQYPGSAHAAP